MDRFASESRFSILHGRPFSNKLMKRRVMLVIFIVLILFTIQFLHSNSTSGRRPKTKITFVNPDLCTWPSAERNYDKSAIIVVLSARNHFEHRNLIRETYGSVQRAFDVVILGVVFMLGNWDSPGSDVTDPDKLQEERNRFGDIVVGDFVDSYRNLTLKTIMAFEWVTSCCRNAQIVIKTDDDVFVNIYQLTKELNTWSPTEVVASNIQCMVQRNEWTIKDKDSIFYASPLDFPLGIFTNHCQGLGYVTSIGVIDRILDEIRKSYPGRVCTHEDAFMTGLVRLHINSNSNYFWRKSEPIELIDKKDSWRNYALQDGTDDEDFFLRNFVSDTSMNPKNLNRFRRQHGTKIFYLITHSDNFTTQYARMWKIVSAAHKLDMIS